MNYNPSDKESVRQAILAAMVELKGYNAAVRILNQQLKSNPGAAANISQDKGFIKYKFSAKPQKAQEEVLILPKKISEVVLEPSKPISNNNSAIQESIPAPAPAPAKKGKKIGSKEQVFYGEAEKTSGGLCKDDLILNAHGKVISKKKSEYGKTVAAERLKNYQANKKANLPAPAEPAAPIIEEPQEEEELPAE